MSDKLIFFLLNYDKCQTSFEHILPWYKNIFQLHIIYILLFALQLSSNIELIFRC